MKRHCITIAIFLGGAASTFAFTAAAYHESSSSFEGFHFVSARCQDGLQYSDGGMTRCESSDFWNKRAEDFCQGHCSSFTGKCGVNNFSVEGECSTGQPKTCTEIREREMCWQATATETCYWDDERSACSNKKTLCRDIDGGRNFTKASITYGMEDDTRDVSRDAHGDYCGVAGEELGMLKEYFCEDAYKLSFVLHRCPYDCKDGACIETQSLRTRPANRQLFDAGKGNGPYDSMTYLEYESESLFTPKNDLIVRRFDPRITDCYGTCWYRVWLYDLQGNQLASYEENGTDPQKIDAELPDVQLDANRPYRIVQRVWTTQSVGIITTGKGRQRGKGTLTTVEAKSDGTDHTDRGSISFQMKGQIIRRGAAK